MKRKTKRHNGYTQGYALLYGRSARAIRIVNGERVGTVDNQKHSYKKYSETVKPIRKVQKVQKKHVISEEAKRKLDNLQDPLDMISRHTRAQKYDAANSTEKYEYGLSDW